MIKKNKFKQMFVIVADRDKKQFNVLGPVIDDTQITNKVCEAQTTGRNIMCNATDEFNTKESIIKTYAEQTGYNYVKELIISLM
jgi:hypothetical protein